MKSIITGALASIAALGLLAGCGSDAKSSAPSVSSATNDSTATTGFVFPEELTIPAGASIPSGVSIPTAAIDAMIAQFEAAGMKVDKACFTALLKDDSLRKLVEAGGTPNQDVIKKFFSCLTT